MIRKQKLQNGTMRTFKLRTSPNRKQQNLGFYFLAMITDWLNKTNNKFLIQNLKQVINMMKRKSQDFLSYLSAHWGFV